MYISTKDLEDAAARALMRGTPASVIRRMARAYGEERLGDIPQHLGSALMQDLLSGRYKPALRLAVENAQPVDEAVAEMLRRIM